jgi:hypothetical protein
MRLKEESVIAIGMYQFPSLAIELQIIVYVLFDILGQWPDLFLPSFNLAPQSPSPMTPFYTRELQRADFRDPQSEPQQDQHKSVIPRMVRFLSIRAYKEVAYLI